MSNPRNSSRESLIRKGRDVEFDSSTFCHTGHILFGHRNQESQTRSLFHPHDRNSNTGTTGRSYERPWMNVSLRHNTIERRSNLQVPLNFAN